MGDGGVLVCSDRLANPAGVLEGEAEVVQHELVGIEAPGDPSFFEFPRARPPLADGQRVGRVTGLVWSPRLDTSIGYVWVPAELANPGNDLEIEWQNGQRTPVKDRKSVV